MWDFFYEHCSYFSEQSITKCFNEAGFSVVEINRVFGDQYMWVEASVGKHNKVDPLIKIDSLIHKYNSELTVSTSNYRELIQRHSNQGLAVWGAGAKGVTFVNVFDQENRTINCVIDINPNKQGKYIPGTGHSIIGLDQIQSRGIKRAIMMNPNYKSETFVMLSKAGIFLELL